MAADRLGPPKKAESVVVGKARGEDGAPCVRLLVVNAEGERMFADFQPSSIQQLAGALVDTAGRIDTDTGMLPYSFHLGD